jgi:tRNA(adenine34) deaminase
VNGDTEDDRSFMEQALRAARQAAELGEVPVGAVLVLGGEVIATAHNQRETAKDPLAHAELIAIRAAAARLGRWRLSGCTLYVTLEPCPMCAGAIVNARLDRLVYGAADPRAGAAGTIMDIVRDERLNHRADVLGGVRGDESALLLTEFFAARRKSAAVP